MGAHSFNFTPKFPQMGLFSPKFYIFARQFSDKKNNYWGAITPRPCLDATELT